MVTTTTMNGIVSRALIIKLEDTRRSAAECLARGTLDAGYLTSTIGYKMKVYGLERFGSMLPDAIALQRRAIINVCQDPKTTDELIAKFPKWDANDLSSVLSELECDGYLIAKSNDTTDILWKVSRKRYEEKG